MADQPRPDERGGGRGRASRPSLAVACGLAVRRRSLSLDPRARLVLAVLVSGVLAGVAAALLTLLLHGVQHLAYGFHASTFVIGVEQSSALRRVLAPTIGATVIGVAWMWLRRVPLPGVREAIGHHPRTMPLGRTLLDACLQIGVVGSGMSIGREGAPRQAAAVLGSATANALVLPLAQRRVLIASAAGAGLAAVYNVPLSGALFTIEVLAIGYRRHRALIALAVSVIAVYAARPVVTGAPTYEYPSGHDVPASVWLWAVVAIPLSALVGRGFTAMMRRSHARAPGPTWRMPVMMGLGGLGLGMLSVGLYAVTGNGKGILQLTMIGGGSLLMYAWLVLAKPAATAMAVGTGVTGGLLTPSLATGAALGATAALLGRAAGLSLPLAAFGLVAAVGVLAVTQNAPWFAAVIGWELARPPLVMVGAFLIVAWGSVLVTRSIGRRQADGVALIAPERPDDHTP